MKFIIVFNKRDKSILLDKGYTFISYNKQQQMWVFENKPAYSLEQTEVQYALSDTLTF